MKELLDLIRPTTVVQLRSTNPYFRHPMPDLDPQWSRSAPHWRPFRELHHLPLESLHEQYDYHLFVTPVRQHNQQGKSRLTRQMSLWAYFSQLNPGGLLFRPLIDHSHRMEIFSFQHISIGILHRQIRVKYFLQVLNASIVALGRIRPDLVRRFFSFGSNLRPGNDDITAGVMIKTSLIRLLRLSQLDEGRKDIFFLLFVQIFRPSNEFPALIDERASVDCLGFGKMHERWEERNDRSAFEGFVRSIDMKRGEIHVLIPDGTVAKSQINALIKGNDDCPDEFYFLSIDRVRLAPARHSKMFSSLVLVARRHAPLRHWIDQLEFVFFVFSLLNKIFFVIIVGIHRGERLARRCRCLWDVRAGRIWRLEIFQVRQRIDARRGRFRAQVQLVLRI